MVAGLQNQYMIHIKAWDYTKMDAIDRKTPCTGETWQSRLEYPLYCLAEDFDHLDCDAVSYCTSFLFHMEQVKHKLVSGCVKDKVTGDMVSPHVWIQTEDGHIVDHRLRKWLGDYDSIPHGIFQPSDLERFTYTGSSFEIDLPIEELAEDLTDGRILEYRDG